jgi:hypothetical protein
MKLNGHAALTCDTHTQHTLQTMLHPYGRLTILIFQGFVFSWFTNCFKWFQLVPTSSAGQWGTKQKLQAAHHCVWSGSAIQYIIGRHSRLFWFAFTFHQQVCVARISLLTVRSCPSCMQYDADRYMVKAQLLSNLVAPHLNRRDAQIGSHKNLQSKRTLNPQM